MTRTVVCSLKPHGSVSSSVRAENFILIWLVNCLSSFLIYIQRTKILLLSKNCLSACKVLIVVFLFSRTGLYSIRFGMLEKLTKLMKICPSYFIKDDLVENLIVSVPSVDPLFTWGGFFISSFNGLTIICLLFSLRWLPPTLCSPQKIKFGGFKCNLIWKTWLEHFSFHGDDSSKSAVDFTITNCLHKFKSKTQHNDQLLCEKAMLEYLEKISRLFLLVLFESHWRKTFSIFSLFVNFYTTKTLPIMR